MEPSLPTWSVLLRHKLDDIIAGRLVMSHLEQNKSMQEIPTFRLPAARAADVWSCVPLAERRLALHGVRR